MKQLLFTLLFALPLLAQEITVPPLVLSEVPFEITVQGIDESADSVTVAVNGKDFTLATEKGKATGEVIAGSSGEVEVVLKQTPEVSAVSRAIPGVLSILPPLLAIGLALAIRQVIVSLFAGIYIGALFVYDYNPLTAFLRVIDTITVETLTDTSNITVVLFTLLFGGVVGVISANGGTKGMANLLMRFAKTRRSVAITAWLSGWIIFFDDYANTLIVGNLMRPVTDRVKISREKLAFIVDSTAAPVASLLFISTWIGFEVGLIQGGLDSINSNKNAYDIFLQTIPFRFYPITILFVVFLTGLLRKDFGPMLKAERRALNGEVISNDADLSDDLTDSSSYLHTDCPPRWYNAAIPILALIGIAVYALWYTGVQSLEQQGITDYGIRDIIGSSDSYSALLWSSLSAGGLAIVMSLGQRLLTLHKAMDAWFKGIRSMLLAVFILTFAWNIGAITNDLLTAQYVIHLVSDALDPLFLPLLVFLICAFISFATGTSWGTMAILMPIVIPLSDAMTNIAGYSPEMSQQILLGVVSSVLTGSVFGDHCSPIADTTILSSMASSCDHIDHVKTQLPYAVTAAVVCIIFAELPVAFGMSPYLGTVLSLAVVTGVFLLFGKKVAAQTS